MDYENNDLTASVGLKTMIELLNQGERSKFTGGKRFIGQQGTGLIEDGIIGYKTVKDRNGLVRLVEITELTQDGQPVSSFDIGKPRYVPEPFKQHQLFNFDQDLNDFYGSQILKDKKSSLYYTPNIFKMNYGKSSDSVSHLTCIFVDIDDVSVETAEQRLATSGLPRPTVAVSSGRGVHYYWVFSVSVNANDYASDRAWKYRKSYLSTWQNLIRYYATVLGGDLKATDPGRYLRIPGSYNPKARKKSSFIYINENRTYNILDLNNQYLAKRDAAVQAVNEGTATYDNLYKPWQYLIKFESTETRKTARTTHNRNKEFVKTPGIRYGFDNYHHLMRQDLLKLAEIRDGIKKGQRFNYLTALRQFGATDSQITEINNELVVPSYTERELGYVLTKEMNYRTEGAKPKRDTIVDWLNITPDEEYEMIVLMREPIGTIKKHMRELEEMANKIEYQYAQQLKRIVIHGLTSKKWTVAKKADLLGITENAIYKTLAKDADYEITIQDVLKKKENEQKHTLTTNRGVFRVSEEIASKDKLIRLLLENIELSLTILENITLHDVPDAAISDYTATLERITAKLKAIHTNMTADPIFKDSKIRVRAVEQQVKHFKELIAI